MKKELFFLFLIFFLLIYFFPSGYVLITPDSLFYLSTASNIFYKKGYTFPDQTPVIEKFRRSPFFQIILVLFFKIFGQSFFSATILLRIFWAVILFLFYFFVKNLFNKEIALGAFLLALFFPQFYLLSNTLLLDFPKMFFVFLFFLFCLKIVKNKDNYLTWAFLGIILALGVLFKESAFLFFPLPLLLGFLKEKEAFQQKIKKFSFYLAFFFLFTFPWAGYLSIEGESFASFFQIPFHFLSKHSKILFFQAKVSLLENFKKNIWYGINSIFPFGFLGLIIWLYFFKKTFSERKKEDFFIFFLFLLYLLPLFYFLSNEIFLKRVNLPYSRHFVTLSFLTLTILSVFLYRAINYFFKKNNFSSKKIFSSNLIFFLTICWIIFIFLAEIVFFPFFNAKEGWAKMKEKKVKIIGIGNLSKINFPEMKKLYQILPQEAKIMTTPRLAFLLNFLFPESNYQYFLFPRQKITSQKTTLKKVLFVWSSTSFQTLQPLKFINYLTEEDLFKKIKENSVEYVLVSSFHFDFFSFYFEKNPGFLKIFEAKDGSLKLFKIKKLSPIDWEVFFDENFLKIFSKNQEKFLPFLCQKFNWSQKELIEKIKTQNSY